mgnify:CR=1 FL=1
MLFERMNYKSPFSWGQVFMRKVRYTRVSGAYFKFFKNYLIKTCERDYNCAKSLLRYASNVLYIVQIKFTGNCWSINANASKK